MTTLNDSIKPWKYAKSRFQVYLSDQKMLTMQKGRLISFTITTFHYIYIYIKSATCTPYVYKFCFEICIFKKLTTEINTLSQVRSKSQRKVQFCKNINYLPHESTFSVKNQSKSIKYFCGT